MKKILYLIMNHIDSIGGVQKSTYSIATQIKNRGYDVGIFMSDGNIQEPKKKCSLKDKCFLYIVNEKNNKSKLLYNIYILKQMKKCIKEYKPDIIHVHSRLAGLFLGVLLKLKLIDKNIKCYFTDRGYFNSLTKKDIILFKKLIPEYDGIIATTNINLEHWRKNTKLKRGVCISNALEKEWFEYDEKKEKELKKQYSVENTFNIGFSGRYVEYKRWDTVMEICKELYKYENIKFFIAISTNAYSSRKQMDEYIIKMKELLSDKLVVMVDADQKQMEEFYYITDAFILTSDGESFGRTLIEAMTKSNLVFGTNSGGVPNVIENEEFLFEVGNVKQICNKLEKYINNFEITEKEKKKFMLYVQNRFNIEKIIDEHIKLYEEN